MTDLMPSDRDVLPKLRQSDVPEIAVRIMCAAIRLFAQKGYAATSVREIVQEAEVTNPMLYYYFENKAGLFSELVRHLFESMADDVAAALSEADSFADKLDGIVWAHLEACRRSPIAVQFVYSVLFGPQTNRPEFDVFGQHVCMLGSIVELFEEAIQSGEFVPRGEFEPLFLTHQFFGLLNGHLMRSLKVIEVIEPADKRHEYLQELLSHEEGARLVEFFLAGAGEIAAQGG
jgi:AcrR family transcriptional regulator